MPFLTLSVNECSSAELSNGLPLIGQEIVPNFLMTENTWVTLSLTFVPSGISVEITPGGFNQSAVLKADWSVG